MFLIGCAAFVLFAVGDINDAILHKKALAVCFPFGVLLLSIAVAAQSLTFKSPVVGLWARVAAWGLVAVFSLLEVHTLFGAIPIRFSYCAPGKKRPVHSVGVYALCRHPGVLWFGAGAICLWLASGFPLYAAFSYTALDVLLVAMEDIYIFPRVLDGYGDYKKRTPFLIPTPSSIKACLEYYLLSKCEET